MATTTSNIPRLIRAAVSHRKATTLPRPHHKLHRHNNSFLTSFLHSHPSNLPISNPHLATAPFSRSVHSRATALHKKPQKHRSIWPYALTLGCTGGLTGIIFYKLREKPVAVVTGSVSEEVEIRFEGIVADMYRKGHAVVAQVLVRPIKNDDDNNINAAAKIVTANKWPTEWEVYMSATEVLADEPHQLASALHRNNMILAHKQLAKQKDSVNRYTTPSDIISGSGADLSKSKSKIRAKSLHLSPRVVLMLTGALKETLNMFKDSPNLLKEGHSVFIKGFINCKSDEIKEDKSDQIKKAKSVEMKKDESNIKIEDVKSNEMDEDKWAKSVTGKAKEFEYHFLAEAVAKHDETYMPREATSTASGWNVAE